MTAPKPIWPARWWWAVLLMILLAAGALRFTGYNFSLPYIDHVDEPAYNIAARMVIDFGSPMPIGMQGYPPGIVTINYVLLRLFHDPATPPGTIIWMVRLISIAFSLGVLVLVGLLAYRVAPPLAGLFAAGLWAVAPIVVEHSRYATADNFVTFFTLLALFLALTAAQDDRDRWATAGVVAGMLAVVFKYQAVFVILLVLVVPLWRLRTATGADRRRIWQNFAVNAAWLGVFAFWLILIFPSLEAVHSPDWSAPVERLSLPAFATLYGNFRAVFDPMGAEALWLPGLLGLLWLIWPVYRRQADPFGLAVIAGGAGLWLFGVSFWGAQFYRQFVALAALLTVLRAVGLAGWAVALACALERFGGAALRNPQWIGGAVLAALVILGGLPEFNRSVQDAQQHTLPDRRNDLAAWADTTLVPGPYIAAKENHKTFNDAWGGYAGVNDFPLAEVADLDSQPVEAWRAQGVRYALVPDYTYQMMLSTPEGRAELAQTLLMKAYLPDPAYRGPDMRVLRLYPIQHEAEGQLGPIRLIGYDLDRAEAAPGDSVTLTLYWQADAPADADYVVYNHLVPLDSREVIAQVDGPPLWDESRRPATTWTDPAEVFESRPYTLEIGPDVPPGEYRLITGFYRRDTGARLLTGDGVDYLLVTTLTVNG